MTWLCYVKINKTSLQTAYIISKSSVFDQSTHMNNMILFEKMGCCLSRIKNCFPHEFRIHIVVLYKLPTNIC